MLILKIKSFEFRIFELIARKTDFFDVLFEVNEARLQTSCVACLTVIRSLSEIISSP